MRCNIPRVIVVLSIALGVSTSHAQKLTIPDGLTVSPQNPSVTFFVSAHFDETQYFAFARYTGTIVASDGIFNAFGPGMMDPAFLVATSGSSSSQITSGQLYFSSLPAAFGSPIDILEVTWTTTNFAPRAVDITTASTAFKVYFDQSSTATVDLVSSLTEMSGTITVIPATSSLPLIGVGGLVAARRRR